MSKRESGCRAQYRGQRALGININRAGRIVISLKYKAGGDSKNGRAEVRLSGKWVKFERQGNN